ncbi:cell filamentation protein Fic [Actinotalea sp. M2MS4P-6]|uniref:cell filamentation protein Fic n=1 Tax=Actinotalea sp. M2MS4P-6 TaxID=2983762 RepID=UPI0021E38D0B|nr:cell filamentation protein Fic [Actinotalea sp. M2MS4P-6]MCV2394899.1 cell filamentation protein Fic [Actinotalea sp. M2MS4P-6]
MPEDTVPEDVDVLLTRVRERTAELRWHPALRRGWAVARVEAGVRAAAAGARCDGVPVDLRRVRELAAGSSPSGVAEEAALGLVRSQAAVVAGWAEPGSRPADLPLGQLLVRLHVAAGGDGRLRTSEQPDDLRGLGPAPLGPAVGARMTALADLLTAPDPRTSLAIAGAVLGELLLVRPFGSHNGAVARAAFRRMLIVTGIDPVGVVVPEVAWAPAPQVLLGSVALTTTGPAGWTAWLRHCAEAVLAGVEEGHAVADAVAAGRLD